MSSPLRERDIAQALAEREGGQCEVRTPAGNIDVLTQKYVYEVKTARQWKAALGQVLAYARAYPERKPRLYLFGEQGLITKKMIEEHCRAAGVGVVWHRDEAMAPREPATPESSPSATDHLELRLLAVDATYEIRCQNVVRLPAPTTPIPAATLEAYLDETLAVFDALMDNALTLQIRAYQDGERQMLQRERAAIRGTPICYRLNLTINAAGVYRPFRVSLPGVRNVMPSGASMGRLPPRGGIPELQRLYELILHPTFPWCNQEGDRAASIGKASYLSLGITKTRNGYRLGGR